jgi:hypothetical protein
MADIEGLSESELASLTSLYRSSGYDVLLKIMADLHGKAVDEYVDSNPEDEKAVITAHYRLNAQRKFAEEVQNQVKRLVEAHLGIDRTPDIPRLEQLLSALPINETEM